MIENSENGQHLPRYSEEIDEIVGRAPRGLTSWGISVLFVLMTILVGVSFLVQYSDVVHAPLTIMAGNAPKAVISRMDGKLVRLFVRGQVPVSKGTILGFMQSTAQHEEVLQLSKQLDHTLDMVGQGKWDHLGAFQYGHLGELQNDYQVFMQSYLMVQPCLGNGLYIRRRAMIQQDLQNSDALKKRLQAQAAVHEKDIEIAKEDFKANEQLYKEKVVALMEYRREQSKLLNKQLPLENTKAALINNELTLSAKQQELVQLEQQIVDQKNGFVQALNVFINEVKKWEAQYLLVAPENGLVMFLSTLHENQDLKTGQELCFIAPANSDYYGEMLLAQDNLGKIKTGQRVLIKLAGYPYQEFGRLTGRVSFISDIPDKNRQYAATVKLDNALRTDYGKNLEFRNALTADAEVVTNKTRLAYKFLYTLRTILHGR